MYSYKIYISFSPTDCEKFVCLDTCDDLFANRTILYFTITFCSSTRPRRTRSPWKPRGHHAVTLGTSSNRDVKRNVCSISPGGIPVGVRNVFRCTEMVRKRTILCTGVDSLPREYPDRLCSSFKTDIAHDNFLITIYYRNQDSFYAVFFSSTSVTVYDYNSSGRLNNTALVVKRNMIVPTRIIIINV